MEIKTKHKKFKSFTDLYSFMVDGHLEEISVTMKYPDGTKSNGIMPIDMVLSFKCIEDIKSLDKELKELATKHNEDINKVREIAETYNWIHDKLVQIENDGEMEYEDATLRPFLTNEQIKLMELNNIDLDRDYTLPDLEKLEDLVYNIMMTHMDENGDYTELAEKYEKIIDVIVKIENEM